MIGVYATLAILLVAATVIGEALLAFASGAGRDRPMALSWVGPGLGLGALLVICGVAARLPGHGVTAAIAAALAVLAGALFLRGRVTGWSGLFAYGAPVVLVTVLAGSLPFMLVGHAGILGAGLVNDDMASHLLIADYVREPAGLVPSFVKGGYPIGPHAVVVAVSEATGIGLVDAFSGFTLLLAPILGLLALGILDELPAGRRVIGSCLVALPYLGAAYLAQGAFKEPLQALILICFALLFAALIGIAVPGSRREPVARVHPVRRVLPVALLAAASVFNYSLPGLLWIGAVGAGVLAARLFLVKPRPELPSDWRRQALPYVVGAIAVLVLATVQEWSRIADFARLQALNPDRFGSDLGNLKHAISPLEALGAWPSGEYRISASDGSLPAIIFYLAAGLALVALVIGLLRSRESGRVALPAALGAVALVWAVTALFSTPYIAAKALAIAAPIVMAVAVRGALSLRGPLGYALAGAFVLVAGVSSFLVLRQSPVGPDDHSRQLEQVARAVQDEPVLFLGRDDFIGWELAGSGEITGVVTNYYSVEDARARFQKGEGGGEKFDVDAVFPKTLDSFDYVLATTGGPQSTPPPRFKKLIETHDYVLYQRIGLVGRRKTLDEGTAVGAVLDCGTPAGRRIAQQRGTAQIWETPPIVREPDRWSPSATATDSRPATQSLELTPGRWVISLEYDSRRPLTVSAPDLGLDKQMPANLDFRGETPTFVVDKISIDEQTDAEVTVSVAEPNWLASLLRAPNEAHLRSLTAKPLGGVRRIPLRQACGEYVDWYRPG